MFGFGYHGQGYGGTSNLKKDFLPIVKEIAIDVSITLGSAFLFVLLCRYFIE